MRDFLSALGLALVIEGVAYALFPQAMKRMLTQIMALPPEALRAAGLATAIAGLAAVWLVRSTIIAP